MAGTNETKQIIVRAFDYASEYNLKAARDFFQKNFSAGGLKRDPLLVQLGEEKMVVLFDYGAIVFFNVERKECERIMAELDPFALRKNKFISEDEFVIHISDMEKRPEGTDELYIRELNRDIALLVGIVLSRSVSMEYYERLVGESLREFESIIDKLSMTGKLPHGRRRLTKQVGFALSVEYDLAYNLSVLDDPDVVWDGGKKIEELYIALKRQFELEERIKVIQQKISIISHSTTFILGRLEVQNASILEWIIIILILLEIVLYLIGKA